MRIETFEVQTQFASGEWANTWQEDDKPLTFSTFAEAKTAIDEHTKACAAAGMTADCYRIEPV